MAIEENYFDIVDAARFSEERSDVISQLERGPVLLTESTET